MRDANAVGPAGAAEHVEASRGLGLAPGEDLTAAPRGGQDGQREGDRDAPIAAPAIRILDFAAAPARAVGCRVSGASIDRRTAVRAPVDVRIVTLVPGCI